MIAADFALYDTLNCLGTAVGASGLGRPDLAETAYLDACMAGDGLFPPGSELARALIVIFDAAAPASHGDASRAWLGNALNAASLAVLPAMEGNLEATSVLLPAARNATAFLPPELRDAFGLILGVVRAMAQAGNGVAA